MVLLGEEGPVNVVRLHPQSEVFLLLRGRELVVLDLRDLLELNRIAWLWFCDEIGREIARAIAGYQMREILKTGHRERQIRRLFLDFLRCLEYLFRLSLDLVEVAKSGFPFLLCQCCAAHVRPRELDQAEEMLESGAFHQEVWWFDERKPQRMCLG